MPVSCIFSREQRSCVMRCTLPSPGTFSLSHRWGWDAHGIRSFWAGGQRRFLNSRPTLTPAVLSFLCSSTALSFFLNMRVKRAQLFEDLPSRLTLPAASTLQEELVLFFECSQARCTCSSIFFQQSHNCWNVGPPLSLLPASSLEVENPFITNFSELT